jgi:hypothetical protein
MFTPRTRSICPSIDFTSNFFSLTAVQQDVDCNARLNLLGGWRALSTHGHAVVQVQDVHQDAVALRGIKGVVEGDLEMRRN